MERSRFFFSSLQEAFSSTLGMEEPSSSSVMLEDTDESDSSRSQRNVETFEFGSGSNFSIESSEELTHERLVCSLPFQHLQDLFRSDATDLVHDPENFRLNVTDYDGKRNWCEQSFDKVLCWPRTLEGTSAIRRCFSQLNGIHYDDSESVTRYCLEGGVWENVTNYDPCKALNGTNPDDEKMLGVTIHVYIAGYCLSLAALVAAMVIFLTFTSQMPWSTSKARKLFHVSAAAEQTNHPNEFLLSDRSPSQQLGESTQVDLAQTVEKLYKFRNSRQTLLWEFASGNNKLGFYIHSVNLLRICQSLSSLRSPQVSERMLSCLTKAWFADSEKISREGKLRNYPEWKLMTDLTYGSILANAFQSSAILLGFDSNEHMSRITYQLGNHLASLLKANLDIKTCRGRIEFGIDIGTHERIANLLPVNLLMEEMPHLFVPGKFTEFEILQEVNENQEVYRRIERIMKNLEVSALSALNSLEIKSADSSHARKLLREIIYLLSQVGCPQELRCLRNKIHIQLILSYILAATLWIFFSILTTMTGKTMSQKGSMSSQVTCVTFILLHYFHLTNFFWMFVEGLYLYVLVVHTFTTGNLRLRVYSLIGWGSPLLVVANWLVVKWNFTTISKEKKDDDGGDGEGNAPCVWIVENEWDWFYKVPALLTLLANIVFLFRIMWVLITKLRSATNHETQQSRKAAKALVVLMPLLGITYVLVLAGPRKFPAYAYIRAILISTQGFLVALLYCFFNGEVRTALRHRWSRCRSGEYPFRSCCGWGVGRRSHSQSVRDSTKCGTESTRLYAPSTTEVSGKIQPAKDAEFTCLNGGVSTINGNSGRQPLGFSAAMSLSNLSNSLNNTHTYELSENDII